MANVAISFGDPANPGTFLSPVFVSTPIARAIDSLAVGDVNGDGLPDIVIVDSDDNYAALLLQDPPIPAPSSPQNPWAAPWKNRLSPTSTATACLTWFLFPSAGLSIYPGDPLNPGTFLPPTTISLGGTDLRQTATADMNRDGLPDIVLGNYSAGTVSVLLNDPAHPGHLLPRIDYPANGAMYDLAIGDLNSDNLPDVVLGGLTQGVNILLNDPANPGHLLPPASFPHSSGANVALGVAIGDIDGDGIPDVVTANNAPSFDLFLGNGDGTLKAATPYLTSPTPNGFEAVSASIADLDGDGLADILIGQFYQNSAQIFLHQPSAVPLKITATELTLNSSVVHQGDTLTITIKVSTFTDPPPGSVFLYDSAGSTAFPYPQIATLPLDATGTATYTISSPSVGFHDIFAHFPGDTTYAPSTSLGSTAVIVASPTVSLHLTASPNPASAGQPVTFTATVSVPAGSPTPTGSVVFLSDSGTFLAIVPLTAGTATLTTSSLTSGSHPIEANYAGDTNYPSQRASLTEVIRYLPATLSSVSSSANPAVAGAPITFTARVIAPGPNPSGTVTFQDGSAVLTQTTLSPDGIATFTTSALAVGVHAITATYSGDTSYDKQSASLSQTIAPPIALTASPNPASSGQPVTLTATVFVPAGLPVPTGVVAFLDAGNLIATAPLSAGTATLTTSSLTPGPHTIQANYVGDTNYTPRLASLTEVIRYLPTTLSLSSTVNPAVGGTTITFTARASAPGPNPTGTVTFRDGTTTLAQITLSPDGTTTFTTNSLTVGTHAITATYSGDANYDPQSASLSQTITSFPTLTNLTPSTKPTNPRQTVTLNATVTGPTTPTGTVTFFDTTTPIGTAALSTTAATTGAATLATTTLAIGTHHLTAIFNGNSTLAPSTSAIVDEQINPRDYALSASTLALHTEHHGTATITATPIGGLSDTVTLTCGSLPLYVTCQVVPTQIDISKSTPQNVLIKIDTDQVLGYARADHPTNVNTNGIPRHLPLTLALAAPCIFFSLNRRRTRHSNPITRTLTTLCLLAALATAITGCSSKYPLSTPPGTYTITINGHGQTTNLDRTTTLTLTVTP